MRRTSTLKPNGRRGQMEALHPQQIVRHTSEEDFLDRFPEQSDSRIWVGINDLDVFFKNVYEYYYQGGFWAMILTRISNILIICWTIILSTFLFVYVNWPPIISCRTPGCQNVSFVRFFPNWNWVFELYVVIFSIYLMWHIISFISFVPSAKRTRQFYREYLGLEDEEISTLVWADVVDQIVHSQQASALCHDKELTALDVTNRIMREENFMLALINMNVIKYNVPWSKCLSSLRTLLSGQQRRPPRKFFPRKRSKSRRRSSRTERSVYNRIGDDDDEDDDDEDHDSHFIGDEISDPADHPSNDISSGSHSNDPTLMNDFFEENSYLSKILDWNVRIALFSVIFNDQHNIPSNITRQAPALRRKFFFLGLINFFLIPFTLGFRIIFFFLKNGEEMNNKKGAFFSFRQWTMLARLKMREFNELPHEFESRLLSCDELCQSYLMQFSDNRTHIIAGLTTYIAGSIVAVLLVVSLINSHLLLVLKIGGRELVWYLGVMSVILGVARSYLQTNNPSPNPEGVMKDLAKITHYFPPHWIGRCSTTSVRDEFMALYESRIKIFVNEIISVFTTPFILMITLPACVDDILEFVEMNYVDMPGVGHICGFATFDFDKYPHLQSVHANGTSNAVLGELPLSRDISAGSDVSSPSSGGIAHGGSYALPHGKFENSFLTFAVNHPNWKGDAHQSAVLFSIAEMDARHRSVSQSVSPRLHGQLMSGRLGQPLLGDGAQAAQQPAPAVSSSTAQLQLSFSALLGQHHGGQMGSVAEYSGLVGVAPSSSIVSGMSAASMGRSVVGSVPPVVEHAGLFGLLNERHAEARLSRQSNRVLFGSENPSRDVVVRVNEDEVEMALQGNSEV